MTDSVHLDHHFSLDARQKWVTALIPSPTNCIDFVDEDDGRFVLYGKVEKGFDQSERGNNWLDLKLQI